MSSSRIARLHIEALLARGTAEVKPGQTHELVGSDVFPPAVERLG